VGIGELLLLAAGAVAGTAVIESVIRRSDVGAALVIGHMVFGSTFPHINRSTSLGPVNIGSLDVVFVVLLTASIARLLRINRFTTAQRIMTVLGLLVIWSILRGAGQFGVPGSINDARPYLNFLSFALYFSTVEPRRFLFDRIARMWLAAAVSLSVLAVARWGAYAAGVTSGTLASATGTTRVLNSSDALVILVGALLALPMIADRARGVGRYLAPALLVVVVLIQHRSVWVVAAAGTVYLLYRQRKIARRMLTVLVASVAMFGLIVATVFPEQDAEVTEQLTRSAQSSDTWEWRVAGWEALLRDSGPEGPAELLAGRPFGAGWERQLVPGGHIVDVSPHNHYLRTFLRVGVLGLAALLGLYAIGLRGTLRASRRGLMGDSVMPPIVLHVVLGVHLLFFIPYSIPTAQGMFLGLACAVAAAVSSDERRPTIELTQ